MPLRRAVAALLLAGLGLAATLRVPFLDQGALFLAPVASVLAASWLGGLPAGLLTGALLVVGLWHFVLAPASAATGSANNIVSLAVFAAVASLISVIMARGKRTAATFSAALWNIDDAVIVTDRHARVSFLNPVATRLTGWDASAAVGKPLAQVFRTLNEQTREPITDRVEGMLRDGVLRESTLLGPRQETLLVATDGIERPILASTASVVDESGDRVGAVLVFRDTSEQRASMAAIREARDAAENANRLKDEFLATLSHELRTPLNAVLGWTKVLQRGSLNSDLTARALDAIDRNADALTSLVSDLLDVSRIVTGKLRLRPQETDVAGLVADSLEAMRPALGAKRLEVEQSIEPVPATQVDPDRLRQVVWNLLSNAIKFTPAGGRIRVGVERVGGDVKITVSDTGLGIDPSLLPFVFNRFWQAESSAARTVGGMGLGLAIVRHLVEAHAGTVTADSPGLNQGATFTVTLPVRAALPAEAPAPAVPRPAPLPTATHALDGLRVLAVDDEADSLDLVAAALGRRGASVRTAQSADEAIRLFGLQVPDIVVADIGMPGKDGYMLVRELRRRPDGALVPAVALTAYAGEPHRQAALDAGFTEHVGKPVDPEQLAAIIGGLTRREPT